MMALSWQSSPSQGVLGVAFLWLVSRATCTTALSRFPLTMYVVSLIYLPSYWKHHSGYWRRFDRLAARLTLWAIARMVNGEHASMVSTRMVTTLSSELEVCVAHMGTLEEQTSLYNCRYCISQMDGSKFVIALQTSISMGSVRAVFYHSFSWFLHAADLYNCTLDALCGYVCVALAVWYLFLLHSFSGNEETVLSAITSLIYMHCPRTKEGT